MIKRVTKLSLPSMVSSLFEKNFLFTFNKFGFLLHEKEFNQQDLDENLSGKIAIVTGASEGLGFIITKELALRGAHVYMIARTEHKLLKAMHTIKSINPNCKLQACVVDLSEPKQIYDFCKTLQNNKVDILINNAGILIHKKEFNSLGVEKTWAVNVVAPHLLTRELLSSLGRSDDARVINVSSAGMYVKALKLEDLNYEKTKFDGIDAYANSKRAEVILNKMWADQVVDKNITFNSMHPGWVNTQGVQVALPKFYRVMKYALRTPEQGADTVIWLAISRRVQGQSGYFWFDRKSVSSHAFGWTMETKEERKNLWELVESQTKVS